MNRDQDADWTAKWWFAEAGEIRATDFNLSANRHRPQSRANVEHRDPLEILEELRTIETEILGEIDELTEGVCGIVSMMNGYSPAALGELRAITALEAIPTSQGSTVLGTNPAVGLTLLPLAKQ